MRFSIPMRVLVLAGSLFSCAAWCQNKVTPGVAPLFSTPVLFSVVASPDAPADRAVGQRQAVPAAAASEKAGSPFAGANVQVKTQDQIYCEDDSPQQSYYQASWWFWYVPVPCQHGQN